MLDFSRLITASVLKEITRKYWRFIARKNEIERRFMGLFENVTLIDIGASYFIPATWSNAVKCESTTLIAIDPNEHNLRHLEDSLKCKLVLIPLAVGREDSNRDFYVLEPDSGSSLFKPELLPEHRLRMSPEKIRSYEPRRVTKIKTQSLVKAIDNVGIESSVWMKLDVQGAELEILRDLGNFSAKSRVTLIELEASTLRTPIMSGSARFAEIVKHLEDEGFELAWIEPVYESGNLKSVEKLKYSGYLAECNLLFIRNLDSFKDWDMPLKISLFLGLVSYGLISQAYQIAANDFPLSEKLRENGLYSEENSDFIKLFDSLLPIN